MKIAGNVFKIILILSINNYFTKVYLATNYAWDSSSSANNVRVFARLLMDVHKNHEYDEYVPKKELLFYCIFVKYAAQLATDRIVLADDQFLSSNDVTFSINQYRIDNLEGNDETVYDAIAAAFDENILNAKCPMPEAVLQQILRLTFSFAARIYTSLYFNEINSFELFEWKIERVLIAYKYLNANNDDDNALGIFPYRFIEICRPFCLTEFCLENFGTEAYSHEQMHYIDNFKFLLALSEHSLTVYEIYKLINIIFNVANKKYILSAIGPPPAVYIFIKQFFKKASLTLAEIGIMLEEFGCQLYWRFTNFNRYALQHNLICSEAKCNNDSDIRRDEFYALREKVFGENLLNYAYAIRIEYDQCKVLVQIANDLKSLYHFELNSETSNRRQAIDALRGELYEELHKILSELEDTENIKNLKIIPKQSDEYLKFLNKIIDEYISSLHCKWNLEEFAPNIPKFGQILFQTLFHEAAGQVHYAGQAQLMAFPVAMAEHFLARLHTLMEMRKISICEIGINLDFVKTLQNILSTEQLDFLPRTKGIPTKVNSQLFKLLLSLAIRLSVQFEHEDLAGDYLNTFIFAYQCITVPKNILEEHCFLKTQITKLDQRIEAKIPILNRDFLIYYSNEHLETIKVKRNFEFLLSLSNHSTTIYDVLKMVQILSEMNANQIWISPTDPKTFLFLLNYLEIVEKPSERIQISIGNKFCLFTYFVEDLLEQIAAEDENISTDEFIGILIGHLSQLKMELCKQNSKKREINKYFDENLLSYAKAIKVNSNIGEGLHQIICVLIGKVKEMVQKREWNYANLKYEQMLEWTLLKIVLSKIGLCGQWKQIEILRGQWAASFDQKYFAESCGESTPNFEEFMQKLVDNLEKIDKML